MRFYNPFNSLDKISVYEFRDSVKPTQKTYKQIKNYYNTVIKYINSDDEEIFTETGFFSVNGNVKDIALAYTRDYIWFDEKYNGKNK